jgi:hypothetical protein|tara:strand:- start:211 stop:468 length:258 start_codon:yes stop_codon:yes gene_type:complete
MPIPTAHNPTFYLHYDRPPSVTVGPSVTPGTHVVSIGETIRVFFLPADAAAAELFDLSYDLAASADRVRDLAFDAEQREQEAAAA